MNAFPSILDVDWPNRLLCASLDMAVVAIVVFCLCGLLRKRSARVRYLGAQSALVPGRRAARGAGLALD